MKAIALGNRLSRDLNVKCFADLGADGRLEVLDAINGGLQRLHALAPYQSKLKTAAIALPAPVTVSIDVTHGSTACAVGLGTAFTAEQLHRTIRVPGDDVDNRIASTFTLLHPYAGATGTVSATIYGDAYALDEIYEELVGDPRILESDGKLTHSNEREFWRTLPVCEPGYYWLEADAANQSPAAPSVIRFDSLPDKLYRLEAQFTLAPARVGFTELLAPADALPLRADHIEAYLLPVARGILSTSSLWKNEATKSAAANAGEAAAGRYDTLVPRTLSTPNNRVGTKAGW